MDNVVETRQVAVWNWRDVPNDQKWKMAVGMWWRFIVIQFAVFTALFIIFFVLGLLITVAGN